MKLVTHQNANVMHDGNGQQDASWHSRVGFPESPLEERPNQLGEPPSPFTFPLYPSCDSDATAGVPVAALRAGG